MIQVANRAAGGDWRALSFLRAMYRNEAEKPSEPESYGADDSRVVAELIRCL